MIKFFLILYFPVIAEVQYEYYKISASYSCFHHAFSRICDMLPFKHTAYLPLGIEAAGPGGSWQSCLYEVWSDRGRGWCWSPVTAAVVVSLLTPATTKWHRSFIPSWFVPTTTNNSWFIPCNARNAWFIPRAPRHPNFIPATAGYTSLIPSSTAAHQIWLFFVPWCCFLHSFYLFTKKIIQQSI